MGRAGGRTKQCEHDTRVERESFSHVASLLAVAARPSGDVPMGIAGKIKGKGLSTSKMYDDEGRRMMFVGEILSRCLGYKNTPEWSAEDAALLCVRYFEDLVECKMPPTLSGLAMYMGWTLKQFDYRLNREDSLGEVLGKAKEAVRLSIEQAAVDGAVNPLIYFHQQKAYHGVIERNELIVTPIRLDPTESEAEQIIDVLPDGSTE